MLTVEVIEQDAAMRALLSEWLAGDGYRVHACAAIGAVATADVDAVVVDLPNLPQQGAETIRRLKTVHAQAPLIGLSTQVDADAGSRLARSLGLARLVAKPCSRSVLLSAVADALGRAS